MGDEHRRVAGVEQRRGCRTEGVRHPRALDVSCDHRCASPSATAHAVYRPICREAITSSSAVRRRLREELPERLDLQPGRRPLRGEHPQLPSPHGGRCTGTGQRTAETGEHQRKVGLPGGEVPADDGQDQPGHPHQRPHDPDPPRPAIGVGVPETALALPLSQLPAEGAPHPREVPVEHAERQPVPSPEGHVQQPGGHPVPGLQPDHRDLVSVQPSGARSTTPSTAWPTNHARLVLIEDPPGEQHTTLGGAQPGGQRRRGDDVPGQLGQIDPGLPAR